VHLHPIPEEYLQGMMVPFKLTFWDQFGNEISVETELSVNRSTTPRPKSVGPRSSLYDSGEIPEMREPFVGEDSTVAATPDLMPCFPRTGREAT
jgi:hypothetical protein